MASLEQALDVKDEFLGLISHELRTPVTLIYGGAQLLQKELPPEDRRDLLREVEAQAGRLKQMIADLLTLARGPDQAAELVPVQLHRILPRMLAGFEKVSGRTTVSVIPGDMTTVLGDENLVEQIVRNLLDNAHKYSPPAQPLEVQLTSQGNEAIVSVLDRGPGVASHELDRIFERFHRSSATASTAKGLGLGLTVCKRLAEAQGGRIWAEAREGGGLVVRFSLRALGSHDNTGIGGPRLGA